MRGAGFHFEILFDSNHLLVVSFFVGLGHEKLHTYMYYSPQYSEVMDIKSQPIFFSNWVDNELCQVYHFKNQIFEKTL